MKLDLTKGISDNEQYKAWIFPGGEIHFKIKNFGSGGGDNYEIVTRLNTSNDIILLLLAVDTIRKDSDRPYITLSLPYMPYQQADMDFGVGECFSLKTISNLINSMNLDKVTIFDPHSGVTPGLVNKSKVVDNSSFITWALDYLYQEECFTRTNVSKLSVGEYTIDNFYKDLIILAPDAGAYKKIYKLCEKIGFNGEIVTCSKTRDHETEKPRVVVPLFDPDKKVLIIDDICLGGRTFLEIKNKIFNPCYLAVSHGVLNNGGYSDPIEDLLKEFKYIFTTNSRKESEEYNNDSIKVLNIFNIL